MPVRLYMIAIDARDPITQGRFWAEVMGQSLLVTEYDEVIVAADEYAFPGIIFTPVKDDKTIKNRLRFDLVPDDFEAEVERIIGLGARPVDALQVQGADWVVLADPEGNEFCVVSPHDSLTD
jgi:predicted enzyme related to lactoylglutathione lyase